ncbi:MAG: DUF115 domain-containing protein [Nitrospiraceae bacterium]|nr:MAG: DUF115 domain-containing protein [Nitrospiraceae bacterium]
MSCYKDRHKGQRCVIIGNGPSLNRMDLSFLKDEISFGSNRIYLGFEKWGFKPTYYVSVNQLVIEQSMKEILKIPVPKFLALNSLDGVSDTSGIILLKTTGLPSDSVPPFSVDPRSCIWEGFTVTFVAMQLAWYMGFSEVVLIGVDHHFVTTGPANKEILSEGQDPNHFDPRYFGKGVRWHLPDLVNSEVAYRIAKMAFEADGRRIVDATVDGKLTIFPKADYRRLFIERQPLQEISRERNEQIKVLIEQAEKKAEQCDIGGALSDTLWVIEQYPEAATAYSNAGVLYAHSGDFSRAMEHFIKALRIDPVSHEAVINCANMFAVAGETGKVRQIYSTYMQRNSIDRNIARLLKALTEDAGPVNVIGPGGLSSVEIEESFDEVIFLISGGNLLLAGDNDAAVKMCLGLLRYPDSEALVDFQQQLRTWIYSRTTGGNE